MTSAELLVDAYERIHGTVHRVVAGLSPEQLVIRLSDSANSVAWLVWHLARIQDDHIAGVAGQKQVWTTQGYFEEFALPFEPTATGYGHSASDVAAVKAPAELLLRYFDAVLEATKRYLEPLVDADLDRIVDTSWNPPVTLGVRLVSVINDNIQHAGQAAFVKGIIEQR